MPSPRLRAPLQRSPIDLTPEEELRVRVTGTPRDLAGKIADADADQVARGRMLVLFFVRWALAAEARGDHERAVSEMTTAQDVRRRQGWP